MLVNDTTIDALIGDEKTEYEKATWYLGQLGDVRVVQLKTRK